MEEGDGGIDLDDHLVLQGEQGKANKEAESASPWVEPEGCVAPGLRAPPTPKWDVTLPKKRSSMNVFGDRTAEEARAARARSIDQAMPAQQEGVVVKSSNGLQHTL